MSGNDIVPRKLGARPVKMGDLSPAAKLGAAIYAAGGKAALVAQECGVTPATAYKWRQDIRVQREIDRIVSEDQKRIVRQVYGQLDGVLQALIDDAKNMDLRPQERHSAAKILMDKFPVVYSNLFETPEARREAREDAGVDLAETELVLILQVMADNERVNRENAERAQRTIAGELVYDHAEPDTEDVE